MKTDIRDYGEGLDVEIIFDKEVKRWIVKAYNQCGYDCTVIDLEDVAKWYARNRRVLDGIQEASND